MAIHICFKYMFLMFHLFQTYVASVLSRCYKSISGCCIYMHVASIMFQVFHTYVANILSRYCIRLQWFSSDFQVFVQEFHTLISSVSPVFFLFVATVTSGYFKSRSGVTHEMCA
jgi:hypothetical protein